MATKKKVQNEFYGEAPQTLADHPFYGMTLNEEQKVFAEAIWNPENLIVFCDSKAGTGKTTIAVGVANMLVQYGLYDGIVYIAAPVQEEKLGYMPGDLQDKVSLYFDPLYQALIKLNINPNTTINQLSIDNQKNGTGYIDAITHVFLRGQNFENKVIICEESQNLYCDELKKVLTRIHDNCKTIVIGHTGQCDLYHYPERSGFAPYIKHFANEQYAQVCTLNKNYRGVVSNHADEL
jgi:phosphate starvation-inducible protein PhoH